MRSLGKLLQLLGLTVGPLCIFLQLNQAISVGQMLTIFVASICAFWIGRIIEGYAR
jgi:hypothetical protein